MSHDRFIHITAACTKAQKMTLYLTLIHNLTIAGRSVWSDETIGPDDQRERLKWLNEAIHRVVNRVKDIHHEHALWSDGDVWQILHTITSQYPPVAGDIGGAMYATLNHMVVLFPDTG